MPPNEAPDFDFCPSSEWSPPLTPLFIQTPPSEPSISDSELEFVTTLPVIDITSFALYGRIQIPVEHNLKDLLLKATETENLEEVSKVQLQVIAREVSLQHLSIYTPQLKELILDGSEVSSLRDLGCGLTNLKILKVNRCGLTSFDGLFGLQTLEELYVADNKIENLFQLTSLPDVKVLDVQRNKLRNISVVTFLTLCEKLENLNLDGNDYVTQSPDYRRHVKTVLPKLKMLDNEYFIEDNHLVSCSEEEDDEATEVMEDKDGSVKEIQPINLNDSFTSTPKYSVLPPIHNRVNRPVTAGGRGSTSPRPSSSGLQSARDNLGDTFTLPTINQTREVTRRLTSATSLPSTTPRNRLRPQRDAWREE